MAQVSRKQIIDALEATAPDLSASAKQKNPVNYSACLDGMLDDIGTARSGGRGRG